jgi:hypothetical protein
MFVRTLSKIARARPASYAGFIVGYGVTIPAPLKIATLNDCARVKVEVMDFGRCGP